MVAPHVQNAKVCCGFCRTEFLSSYLIIRGKPPLTKSQEARHICLPYSGHLPEHRIMLIFLASKAC